MPSAERVARCGAVVRRVIHELPLERRTLHGHFSRDLAPVLTIDPGDRCRFATPNAGWMARPIDRVRAALVTGGRRARARRARSRCAARAPARRSSSGSTTSRLGRGARHSRSRRIGSTGSSTETTGRRLDRARRRAPPVPRRARDAAGRARRALDDPAAAAGREHRLQGARRGDDALPADPRRRRAVLGRRRPRPRKATGR